MREIFLLVLVANADIDLSSHADKPIVFFLSVFLYRAFKLLQAKLGVGGFFFAVFINFGYNLEAHKVDRQFFDIFLENPFEVVDSILSQQLYIDNFPDITIAQGFLGKHVFCVRIDPV